MVLAYLFIINSCRVYADAVEQIRAWHNKGVGVWIYSSGSVEAQKLLFKYSEAGNMLEVCTAELKGGGGGGGARFDKGLK